jgi:hypothetical protein
MFDSIPYIIVDDADRVISVSYIRSFDNFGEIEARADVHAKVRGERVHIAAAIWNSRGEIVGHERVGISSVPA